MLSRQENERITRTGAGTPAGDLLRRYWQPAALVEELPHERAVKAVQLFGEELVLFRDEQGRYGLLGLRCPHRGADLSFGRLEDGGLRCLYHGWLFDVDGRCLEQPAEPEDSRFCEKVRHTTYPCQERNGIVFAYMGPGQPPSFPELDCFEAPDAFTFAFKGRIDCNWLQALEGGIDPSHVSFLHRYFVDNDPADSYGQQLRGQTADTSTPLTQTMREHTRPRIDVESADHGLRILTRRRLEDDSIHIRVTNLLFPNAIVIPMNADMILTQWHMPIDDVRHWWYAIFYDFRNRVDKSLMRQQRVELYDLPDYIPRRNRANNYGFDPREQRELTYTGMGMDINAHDTWAVESAGAVQDRTVEHLGTADKAISAYRRMLRKAIDDLQQGKPTPLTVPQGEGHRFRGPVAVDTRGREDGWETVWKQFDLDRRRESAWAPDL